MEQPEFVRYVLNVLDDLHLQYAVVGSFASIAFGEPRFTNDIDILVQLDQSSVSMLNQLFPAPEWYISESAVLDAISRRTQFNVIHSLSGNKVDFIVAGESEWYKKQFERRMEVKLLPDRTGFSAHPEDVILGKLQFYRDGQSEKHLRDIAGILSVSGEQIDYAEIAKWAVKLNVIEQWQAVLDFFDKSTER